MLQRVTRISKARHWIAALAIAGGVTRGPLPPATQSFDAPAATQSALSTTRPTDDPAIAKLIDQLSSDDYHTRLAAQKALVARGEPVRAELVRLTTTGATAEVRAAAAEMLAQLDQAAADRPTTITLHLKNASPREVFTAIRRQMHLPLPLSPSSLWSPRSGTVPHVTVDWKSQPFWTAIAQVCSQSGATLNQTGPHEELTVISDGSSLLAGPTSSDGLFTLEATSATRNATVSYNTPGSDSTTASMSFLLYIDPKLTITRMGPLTLVEAIDDKGHTLGLPATGGDASDAVPDSSIGWMHPLQADLPRATDGATQLARLKAELTVAVPTKTETLQIDDLQKAVHVPSQVGDWVLTLQEAKIVKHKLTYALDVTLSAGSAPDVYAAVNHIQLVDAAGHVLNASESGGSGTDQQVHMHEIATCAQTIKPPVRLTLTVATEVKPRVLHFMFTNLKLPAP